MKYLVLFILCSSSLTSMAQEGMLKGTLRDTVNKADLRNAVIYLKDPVKSTLQQYTRSGNDGRFEMRDLSSGVYIMVVTFPGYVDWIDSVMISGSPVQIVVNLTPQSKLLEEVVVKASKSPIRIKGDTTEYLADSFHLRPDATVEDLLRILPGWSVNAKGQISVHGQRIQNVLVDGEEFFGNDPTMATQNLNKTDIAKVQVYERKSDKAVITGIDDGVKERTVNLVLKDDAKKGYFGEVAGGSDFNKYYQSKATISRFTSSSKAGAFFSMDRTGRGNASYDEENDFGSSFSPRQGIPEVIQGAGMFNKKFGALKSSTANNFNYNHLNIVGDSYTGNKYILRDTVFYSNQSTSNKSSSSQQSLSSKTDFKLDSTTTLTVHLKGRQGENDNASMRRGKYLASDNATLLNANEQSNVLSGDEKNGSAEVFFKKAFNAKGTEFLTLNTSFWGNTQSSEGYLYNKTTFYTDGVESGQELIDQKKNNSYRSNAAQALASYVTPLSRFLSLNINYAFNLEHTTQDTRAYEKSNGKYDSLIIANSSKYNYVNASHQGGASLSFNRNKISAKTGLAVQGIRMKQYNYFTDSTAIRHFINVFPTANFTWRMSSAGSMGFTYSGRTQQPTFAQLQPIQNNNDPLNIQVGNPYLRPAFFHSFEGQFSHYKTVIGRIIRGAASITFAQNDFNTSSTLDNQGRRVYQTINVDGNYNYNAWLTYGRNLNFLHLTVSVQPSISGARYSNFINGEKNTTTVFTFGPTTNINGRIDNILDIQSSYGIEFRRSESSINPALTNRYHIHTIWLHLMGYDIKGWRLASSFNYNIRSKLSVNDVNTNAAIWNLTVERKIIPKANISAILRLNDILNQNVGFSRSINSNGITENTYETVQRYVMLSLSWKFNKNRGAKN